MIDITQEEIMKNWGEENLDNPLVSISCTAYNQENYISQTLDGFLIQKTNFPFEVIVHDDASTDKTAALIREYEKKYPKIIKPIYEIENQYSKHDGSLTRIMLAHYKGKYIAYCEGDDYWINENKLQLQVDFLENNSEYGMCYTKAKNFYQEMNFFSKSWGGENETFVELLKQNTVPTLTVMLRIDLRKQYFEQKFPIWLVGDYPLWLWISKNTKIHFIDETTGVYRVLDNSASHSSDINKRLQVSKSIYDLRLFFAGEQYKDLVGEYNENRECVNYYFRNFDRENTLKYIKKIEHKTKKEMIIHIIVSNKFLFACYKMLKK